MSSAGRPTVQVVIGLGLAAVLLIGACRTARRRRGARSGCVMGEVPVSSAIGFQVLMLAGLYSYTFTFTGSLRGLQPQARR